MVICDEFILKKMSEAKKTRFEPQFNLDDLVGKTIIEHRKIKNPREYNPEFESPNPEDFDVLVFSDGSFLVTECYGDGESGHLDCYFYDGQKTLYSGELFGVI